MIKLLWDYATIAYNREYRRTLLSLITPNHNEVYLDLGCGDGVLTLEVVAKLKPKVAIGLDLLGGAKGLTVVRADLEKPLPFRDDTFSLVTASQIIEHLSETDQFLKEIYRTLKPNGKLIISTNNLASLSWLVMLAFGIQPPTADVSDEMPTYNWLPRPNMRRHRRLFTLRGLAKLLTYHHFKVEGAVGSSYFPLPTSLARLAAKLDRIHANCITIVASKGA